MHFLLYVTAVPEGFPYESKTRVLPGSNIKSTDQYPITVNNKVIEGKRIIESNFTP